MTQSVPDREILYSLQNMNGQFRITTTISVDIKLCEYSNCILNLNRIRSIKLFIYFISICIQCFDYYIDYYMSYKIRRSFTNEQSKLNVINMSLNNPERFMTS